MSLNAKRTRKRKKILPLFVHHEPQNFSKTSLYEVKLFCVEAVSLTNPSVGSGGIEMFQRSTTSTSLV